MLYPIYVRPGDKEHAHGVTIPGFPWCFSASDEWSDIHKNVQEAIELYCEDEEFTLPKPSSIESLLNNEEFQNGVWLMIEIDFNKISRKVHHIR